MVEATGNLAGHFGPGLAYVAWAWTWLAALRREPGPVGAVVPIERGRVVPWMKVAALAVGAATEMPPSTWSAMSTAMAWNHIAMYLPVAFSGAVDLLARRGRVSAGATHGAYALAFILAGLVLLGHGNPGGVEGTSHLLLSATYGACALAALAELAWPGPRARWLRAGAQLALGFWWIAIGWALYLSGWDLGDPSRVLWLFTMYAAAVTLAAVVIVAATPAPASPPA